MKVHIEFSNMQNLKPKQKQYSFVLFLAEKSKTVVPLCTEGNQRAKTSITYFFTMAHSCMINHFLTFTYGNIFSVKFM